MIGINLCNFLRISYIKVYASVERIFKSKEMDIRLTMKNVKKYCMHAIVIKWMQYLNIVSVPKLFP